MKSKYGSQVRLGQKEAYPWRAVIEAETDLYSQDLRAVGIGNFLVIDVKPLEYGFATREALEEASEKVFVPKRRANTKAVMMYSVYLDEEYVTGKEFQQAVNLLKEKGMWGELTRGYGWRFDFMNEIEAAGAREMLLQNGIGVESQLGYIYHWIE